MQDEAEMSDQATREMFEEMAERMEGIELESPVVGFGGSIEADTMEEAFAMAQEIAMEMTDGDMSGIAGMMLINVPEKKEVKTSFTEELAQLLEDHNIDATCGRDADSLAEYVNAQLNLLSGIA